MASLTIVFPGTSMKWQHQANFLEMHVDRPHNMNEPNAEHRYFFADGVAVEPTNDHYVVTSVEFDPANSNRLLKGRTWNAPGQHLHEMLWGSGMRRNARAVFDMIKHYTSPPHNMSVDEINIVGFSRGGCVAKVLAQMLAKDPVLSKTDVNMALIDPVPGPGNNTRSLRRVPANVKKYMVGLAVDETAIGFNPLDFQQTIFSSPATKYCFLPFRGDHLGSNFWMKDLIKHFLPANSSLYPKEAAARERLLKAVTALPADPERDARAKLYNENLANYARDLTVENYYQYKDKEVSIQADASAVVKKITRITKRLNIRRVKVDYHKYSHHLFVNAHHELLFSQEYPAIYQVLIGSTCNYSLANAAQVELNKMPDHTRAFFYKHFDLAYYNRPFEKIYHMAGYLQQHKAHYATNCSMQELADFFKHSGKTMGAEKRYHQDESESYKPNSLWSGVINFFNSAFTFIKNQALNLLSILRINFSVRNQVEPPKKPLNEHELFIKNINNLPIEKVAAYFCNANDKIVNTLWSDSALVDRLLFATDKQIRQAVLARHMATFTDSQELFWSLKRMFLQKGDQHPLTGISDRNKNYSALKLEFYAAYVRQIASLLKNSDTWLETRKGMLNLLATINQHPLLSADAQEKIISDIFAEPECTANLIEFPSFKTMLEQAIKHKQPAQDNLVDWFIRYATPHDLLCMALESKAVAQQFLKVPNKQFLLEKLLAADEEQLYAFLQQEIFAAGVTAYAYLMTALSSARQLEFNRRLEKLIGSDNLQQLAIQATTPIVQNDMSAAVDLTSEKCWTILTLGTNEQQAAYFNYPQFWAMVTEYSAFANMLEQLHFSAQPFSVNGIPLNSVCLAKLDSYFKSKQANPDIMKFINNHPELFASIDKALNPTKPAESAAALETAAATPQTAKQYAVAGEQSTGPDWLSFTVR